MLLNNLGFLFCQREDTFYPKILHADCIGEVFAFGKSEVVRGTVKFEALPQVKLILLRAKSVIRSETSVPRQNSQHEVF